MKQATFIAPHTNIDTNFWINLYDKKLNTFKLDNTEQNIYYNDIFDVNSFENNSGTKCFLIVSNTIEELKNIDKKNLLESKKEYLTNNNIYCQNIFNTKIVLSFIDLKNYKFTYIVGNPTLIPDIPYEFSEIEHSKNYEEINLNDINWKNIFNENTYCSLNFKVTKTYAFDWKLRNLLAFFSLNNDTNKTCVKIMLKLENTNENKLFVFNINKFSLQDFKIIGWEKPQICDLSAILDKSKLIKQANDLNLKLMKWNMWKDLNLEKISNTKCLLIGAGTLGCSIARLLVGWGFLNFTFVDNGKISYSNPSRQSLYETIDCDNTKFKANVASEKLLKINPELKSIGYCNTILCPDHPIVDESLAINDFNILENLIKSHDVIFTLTDDRESRWLPTMLCNCNENKLLINVALGFDTYLISKFDTNNKKNGCYFCTDILAVHNTHKNRSDDQKCTITRPGISAIASGLAVEMLINHIHEKNKEIEQIRGNVITYEINCMKALKSNYCVACSDKIKQEYLKFGYDFIKNSCDNYNHLENISGITDHIKELNLDYIDIECD